VVTRAFEVVTVVARVLKAARQVEARLDRLTAPALLGAVTDVHVQLSRLVHPLFVTATGAARLPDLLRYLEAMERRLDKLADTARRDVEVVRRIQALEERYARLVDALPPEHPLEEVEHIRWMLEELRVSTFAQALGTPYPVSEQRVARELDAAAALLA
jgi:ATP-dependent helicase HrpA